MNRFVFVAVALILVAGTVVQGRSVRIPRQRSPPPGNNYIPRSDASAMQYRGSELATCGYEKMQINACEHQKDLLIKGYRDLKKSCKTLASEQAEPLASEEAEIVSRLEQTEKKQLIVKVEKLLEKLLLETA